MLLIYSQNFQKLVSFEIMLEQVEEIDIQLHVHISVLMTN
jgi:hypothetical protein